MMCKIVFITGASSGIGFSKYSVEALSDALASTLF